MHLLQMVLLVGLSLWGTSMIGLAVQGRAARAREYGYRLTGELYNDGSWPLPFDCYLGPVSGAHFNPVVSGVSVWEGRLSGYHGIVYMLAQVSGAFGGVASAHAMFGLPIVQISAYMRPTLGESFGEFIATFGLVLGHIACTEVSGRGDPDIGCTFITSAYWFTSSTSFANPAVTFARAMTDTFAGISPRSVPLFIGGQIVGAVAATLFGRWLLGPMKENDMDAHRMLRK
jgi:glycerol uptake facilitator-like aquaporin